MARTWTGAAACLLLASCTTTQVDLEGDDSSTVFPALRLAFPIDPDGENRASVEVRMSGAGGEDDQGVGAGTRVTWDGVDFVGPQAIELDWTLAAVDAVLRYALSSSDRGGFDLLAGLGASHLDLEVSAPGQDADDRTFALGPLLGARAWVAPAEPLKLYLEATFGAGFGDDALIERTAFEAGLEGRLARHVGLVGGWRAWTYDEERDDLSSDVELELSGPFVGLSIRF